MNTYFKPSGSKILFTCISFCLTIHGHSQPCKEVVGYYPDWKLTERNSLVSPATIDYSKYTILNYAFFKTDKSGFITGLDSAADEILLKGKSDANNQHIPGTSLTDLAHQHH